MSLVQLRARRDAPPQGAERLFCSRPFEQLDVQTGPRRGAAYLCCPSWLPVVVGNVMDGPIDAIWNGEPARALRRSILDGSFAHCTSHCPFLQTRTGPVMRAGDVTDPASRAILDGKLEVMPRGPRTVAASFDASCNLACPTCRSGRIIEREAAGEITAIQRRLTEQALHDATTLYITGSGDAFGSPYNLAWLRTLNVDDKPDLRIHLHTNAQLWTRRIWASIPAAVRARIQSTEISIDAASAETYRLNRVGGNWDRLLRNLAFIAELRAQGPLGFVNIHMVVQANNVHEMPAFAALGAELGFDKVYFSHLVDWGTFSRDELARRSIHQPSHPRHAELREMLQDPRLATPSADRPGASSGTQIDLGNLTEVVRIPSDVPAVVTVADDGGGGDGAVRWVDLYVDDVDVTRAFCDGLFGWRFTERATAPGLTSSVAHREHDAVLAVHQRTAARQRSPAWGIYLDLPAHDPEVVARRAAARGGALRPRKPRGVELLTTARVDDWIDAIVDPADATLLVWTPAHPRSGVHAGPGAVTWYELMTHQPASAAFHAEVLGWSAEALPGIPGGVASQIVLLAPRDTAVPEPRLAIRQLVTGADPRLAAAAWLAYVEVADCDAGAARAEALGGEVVIPPHDVPGVGRLAVVADPQGALFGLRCSRA